MNDSNIPDQLVTMSADDKRNPNINSTTEIKGMFQVMLHTNNGENLSESTSIEIIFK